MERIVDPFDKRGAFGWMIDASHNVKDPIEDLMQSVEAINPIGFFRELNVRKNLITERGSKTMATGL